MSDTWELVREAIAAKLIASSGVRAAGLRKADTLTEDTMSPPEAKVLWPTLEMHDQTADTESYDLRIPVEVMVPTPTGRGRSAPTWSAIARAIQVEWRIGITLGLSASGVWHSQMVSVTPGLTEYDETGLDGCTIEFLVRIMETVSPSRTA